MLIAAAHGTWATVPTTNVVCRGKRNRNDTLEKYHCDHGFDWTPIHSIVVNGRCPGRQMTKGQLHGPSVIAPLPDNRFQNENKSYLSFKRSRVRVSTGVPALDVPRWGRYVVSGTADEQCLGWRDDEFKFSRKRAGGRQSSGRRLPPRCRKVGSEGSVVDGEEEEGNSRNDRGPAL